MKETNIISTIEHEFGRLLTPIENEIVSDWKSQGFTDDKIREALKESVFRGVCNLKYINKILMSWQKEQTTSNEPTVSVDDLSWLDEKF